MDIRATHTSRLSTIHICGELDSHTATTARKEIDNILQSSKSHDVVYDLDCLDFMDSTGIGLLLGRYKKYLGKKRFFIKNVNSTIDRILTMSGVYKIIQKIN